MMRCIDHPTMLRDGVAWGAPTGVASAYMASTGFTGAPAITIEKEDTAEFWDDLGAGGRIADHTHYKRYRSAVGASRRRCSKRTDGWERAERRRYRRQ